MLLRILLFDTSIRVSKWSSRGEIENDTLVREVEPFCGGNLALFAVAVDHAGSVARGAQISCTDPTLLMNEDVHE